MSLEEYLEERKPEEEIKEEKRRTTIDELKEKIESDLRNCFKLADIVDARADVFSPEKTDEGMVSFYLNFHDRSFGMTQLTAATWIAEKYQCDLDFDVFSRKGELRVALDFIKGRYRRLKAGFAFFDILTLLEIFNRNLDDLDMRRAVIELIEEKTRDENLSKEERAIAEVFLKKIKA